MPLPFKISALVFVSDGRGRQLLIRRAKEPNFGLWSPIGGKLEMALGESPFECAARETREEIGLDVGESDFHLFAMVSERGYEGSAHWLMFLFDCKKKIDSLPEDIGEGRFGLFDYSDIKSGKVEIPETDKTLLWNLWEKYREGSMAVMRVDCSRAGALEARIQQIISK
ncbi:MAG: NUDIX hydrolase [Opitutales bacterium]|nr:NUDIX hydrolase [Opitutales bacterium]